MKLLNTILRLFPSTCSHSHTYRERRKLHGVQVMHFVCERCDYATPAVERTASEHQLAVQFGDRPSARIVRPQHGQLVSMDALQRRKPA